MLIYSKVEFSCLISISHLFFIQGVVRHTAHKILVLTTAYTSYVAHSLKQHMISSD